MFDKVKDPINVRRPGGQLDVNTRAGHEIYDREDLGGRSQHTAFGIGSEHIAAHFAGRVLLRGGMVVLGLEGSRELIGQACVHLQRFVLARLLQLYPPWLLASSSDTKHIEKPPP